ncbi:permease [Deinococcus malanensis]|uniref:Permease n=1 Tax=Deinococcus malanensis TaxID=1706855 RepID=A0ABQ2F095_9DEIO|nr:DMT family transporter [Deinococcus malanensis]GGK34987.1 permease [Deinococcus malanensis]
MSSPSVRTVPPTPASHLLGVGLLLFVAFVWGTMFVVVKNLTTVLSTAELMTWRYVLAALPLLPFLRHATSPHLWRHGAVIGVLLFVVVSTQTAGLAFTTANRAAFITGLAVILAPLATAFLARQRVPSAVWIGAVLCLVGLAFLSLEGTPLNIGDALVLGTAVSYTAYVLFLGKVAHLHAALTLTTISILTNALLSAVWMFGQASLAATPLHLPPVSTWGALVFVSLIGTVGMYLCQIHGQRRVSPSETVIILSLEPLFTVLASLVFLHEAIGLRGMLGAVLMIGGLLYSQLVPMANARKAGQDT